MEIIGQKRQKIGKEVKNLRKEGLIPAVVFGNEIEPTAIVLNQMGFSKLYDKAGETALVDLKVETSSYKVLINAVQYDPITGKLIHASFFKPNLKEKTEVQVPVEIIGEDKNPLVKSGEGVILQLMNEIHVRALPTDLPEAFVVDVSALTEIGAGVTIGQLTYDRSKVEIKDLDDDELVAKIDNAIMEEETTEGVDEAAAIENLEASSEKKAEEEEEEK